MQCVYCHELDNEDDDYNKKPDDFSMEVPYDWDTIYIGRSWKNIADNETGTEFKKSIEERLKKIFGNEIKCETFEEAWQDG